MSHQAVWDRAILQAAQSAAAKLPVEVAHRPLGDPRTFSSQRQPTSAGTK